MGVGWCMDRGLGLGGIFVMDRRVGGVGSVGGGLGKGVDEVWVVDGVKVVSLIWDVAMGSGVSPRWSGVWLCFSNPSPLQRIRAVLCVGVILHRPVEMRLLGDCRKIVYLAEERTTCTAAGQVSPSARHTRTDRAAHPRATQGATDGRLPPS